MVSIEALISRFYIENDILYWKNGPRRNKPAGCHSQGYIIVRGKIGRDRFCFLSHQIIFAIYYGYIPDLIDHRDRDSSNNSKENLREASKQINSINTGMYSHNTSGYKGVSWDRGKWTAQIKHNKKKIYLGRFSEIGDAVSSRLKAEEKLWHDLK